MLRVAQNSLISSKRQMSVIILLFFLTSILISCGVSDVKTDIGNSLILEEIQFDHFNTLKFTTLSGGRIYRLQQEFAYEGETRIEASFKFNYFQDSIVVIDQLNPVTRLPYLSVKLQDNRPIQVVRYFAAVDVQLIHNITYTPENDIRIDLTRIASNGDEFHVGYAIYHFNSNGNVLNNKHYFFDRDSPGDFEKSTDKIYTYDNYVNPQMELYLPFFNNIGFPHVQFFSKNNILSVKDSIQTSFYDYEYGNDNQVLTQELPNGQTLYFRYLNRSE